MDEAVAPEKLGWRSRRLRLKVLGTALALAFVCYAFFTWVLWPVKVTGDSMLPNYFNDSRHFIYKLAYWSGKPRRGDVVGMYFTNGDVYIKRIIGLPGEEISFDDGVVAINGKPLQERYVRSKVPWELNPVKLGEDDYFVMGDNRATSWLGSVPLPRIIGKVVY